MSNKRITFFMEEKDIKPLNLDVKHGYYETLKAIKSNENRIYTTQLSLLDGRLFAQGCKIFVVEKNLDKFEIKLGGENERTHRDIHMGHNLEKMLIAGEFDDDCHCKKCI